VDFKVLFDSSFLIALSFLAIVTPLFSLSVSLLGRAIEKSKEKNAKAISDAEDELKEEVQVLEKQIADSKDKNIIENLPKIEQELNKLKQKRKTFEKKSAAIIKHYDLIKFRQSVVVPGLSFIFAIISSLLAKICIFPGTEIMFWFFSLIFLILGIGRICQSLTVMQEVGLDSDKHQEEKMAKAIYEAYKKQGEEAAPRITFKFEDLKEPIKLPKLSETVIPYSLTLGSGKIAKQTEVHVIVSKEFDFINAQTKWTQGTDFIIPNGLSTKYIHGDIRRGFTTYGRIKIKTPEKPGKYKIQYNVSSEEFHERKNLDIEIF